VRSAQEEQYAYLNSQIVIASDLEQSNAPPPFSLLRTPYALVQGLRALYARLVGGRKAYMGLGDHHANKTPYTHWDIGEVMERLDEINRESDQANVPDLVRGLERRLMDAGVLKDEADEYLKEGGREPQAADVRIFNGFHEEASRLVFHYGDKVGVLPCHKSRARTHAAPVACALPHHRTLFATRRPMPLPCAVRGSPRLPCAPRSLVI
jgi:hypothetical protein